MEPIQENFQASPQSWTSYNDEKKEVPVNKAVDETRDGCEEVELIKNKFTQNTASPFVSQSKSWDDVDHFQMPPDIQSNVVNELGFAKPSIIQSFSIPLIAKEPYDSLIAQAKNGTGKTGSFAIGSILRIDRSDPRTQVWVITHTRELCNQVFAVYQKITKGTGITVCNLAE